MEAMTQERKPKTERLNVGCGTDIRPDFVNLDCVELPGVDVRHDILQIPWPFPDASFVEVLCLSVLEHVDLVPTMREIHRLLKPGGIVNITVPHFTAPTAYEDPTHRNHLSCGTFHFFTKASNRPYYFDFQFARVESVRLVFGVRKLFWWNYLLNKWVNRSFARIALYESSPLRILPASHFEVVLRK
jgi:SAM-dependent methyltransferase